MTRFPNFCLIPTVILLLWSLKQVPRVEGELTSKISGCKTAIYYYSVVSAEQYCTASCVPYGQVSECKNEVVESVCKDGSRSKFRWCDIFVDVDRRRDYDQAHVWGGSKGLNGWPVPWYMKDNTNPSFYDKVRDGLQYLYLVNDTDVTVKQCAELVVMVNDYNSDIEGAVSHNNKRAEDYEKILAYRMPLKIPKPGDTLDGSSRNRVPMGKPFTFSKSFRTKGKCGADGYFKVKVSFLAFYLKMVTDKDEKLYSSDQIYNSNDNVIKSESKIKTAAIAELEDKMGSNAPSYIRLANHRRICYEKSCKKSK